MYRIVVVSSAVLLLLACGSMTPQEKILGRWEASMFGETMTVEFRDDGTVYTVEEDEVQNWQIIEGDPLILEIWDPAFRSDAVQLELVFDGNDRATLSAEGLTSDLQRIE